LKYKKPVKYYNILVFNYEVSDLPNVVLTSVCASVIKAKVKMSCLLAWYVIVQLKFEKQLEKSVDYDAVLKLVEVLYGNFTMLQHPLNIFEYFLSAFQFHWY
jgi:hypothetical protein